MAQGRENPSEDKDVVASGDGSATLRLRQAENATAVSRRGVLWRAGLATAAGGAALTALDARRADAATSGNFILGESNSATSTTTLATPGATTGFSLLMKFDGSVGGVTNTTVEIDSPTGGVGLKVISVTAGSNAIMASSALATGIWGASTSGTGVMASSASGAALSVDGMAHFSRSGSAIVAGGSQQRVVNVSGMKASSLVLVTLQTSITGIYVAAAVPVANKFTVHLNSNTPTAARFAWFVLN